MLKRFLKRCLVGTLRFVPLDALLFLSQQIGRRIASILLLRDWRLEAYGRPQFFKHEINMSLWRFEPARWSFAARGVYARENMFRGCSVLDLSCGDGSNSYLFFSDIAGHIDAMDNDTMALSYARRYHAAPAISYHQIDIVNQSLPARRYDFVIWNAAICYFTEDEIKAILRKISGVAAEETLFFGMLPAASGYADHKTEFSEQGTLKAFLGDYFGVVTVREVNEASGRTFYFKASSPLHPT
jgi:SAM-dependent methyltransferase